MKVCAPPKGFEAPDFNIEDWREAEADHAARLKQHLLDMGHQSEYTGEIISFGVADGAAQYMVVDGPGRYGSRTFLIHLAYGDGYQYRGVEHFPKAEIIKMAKQAQHRNAVNKRAKDWWEDRKLGEIVHYSNGFGQYVRGVIVQTHDGKAMKPVALVGKWENDLPTRYIDGTIHYPYHVKQILDGETMKPHESNMYEANLSNRELAARHTVDPRKLAPISFELPPMTPEEVELARVATLRNKVIEALNDRSTSTTESILSQLRAAAKMLEEAV